MTDLMFLQNGTDHSNLSLVFHFVLKLKSVKISDIKS